MNLEDKKTGMEYLETIIWYIFSTAKDLTKKDVAQIIQGFEPLISKQLQNSRNRKSQKVYPVVVRVASMYALQKYNKIEKNSPSTDCSIEGLYFCVYLLIKKSAGSRSPLLIFSTIHEFRVVSELHGTQVPFIIKISSEPKPTADF